MYLRKPPYLYRKLFPQAIFTATSNKVLLTFDDGPDPQVTPKVLQLLNELDVKAIFFVLGQNAVKHPEIVDSIRAQGHDIASHGFAHLDGWKVDEEAFYENVVKGAEVSGSHFFRPPYGRMWPGIMGMLTDHKVVMWDLLSGDFDRSASALNVAEGVLNNVRAGSIIVMHDSKKAEENVLGSLERIVYGVRKKGLEFGNIHDI